MRQQPYSRRKRTSAARASVREKPSKQGTLRATTAKPGRAARQQGRRRPTASRGSGAASYGTRSAASTAPYVIGGIAVLALILLVVAWPGGHDGNTAPAGDNTGTHPYDHIKPTQRVDPRSFAGGFPSRAEDLYREGHALLNEAMPREGGVDSQKLKAALRRLDAAVDGYYELEKKHPDDQRIKARINKINKLRAIARKNYSL